MQELYGRLRDGVGPVRALARTQRAFAHSSDPRLSDPIAWAPFVLYGGY
jgi:CHAT domain-containing protein